MRLNVLVARNFRSAVQTVKRLEEAAMSYRGSERVQLIRRWLIVLKEIDKPSGVLAEGKEKTLELLVAIDEATENPRKPSMILYYDTDVGGKPINFREVFLRSQALEGITISMILEAPNDEEVSLLLEMFGLCLSGGKEVHNAIVSSIQDLATAISNYQDEVLVKTEELLQFAQGAVNGLKKKSELGRIDAEASSLKRKLNGIATSQKPLKGDDKSAEETTATIETPKYLRRDAWVTSGALQFFFLVHGERL